MIIEFAGKDYKPKNFTLNDWIELEDNGFDVNKFKKGAEPSFKDLRTLAWVVLKKADPSITKEFVGDNIDPIKDSEVFNSITAFISAKESPAIETTSKK